MTIDIFTHKEQKEMGIVKTKKGLQSSLNSTYLMQGGENIIEGG